MRSTVCRANSNITQYLYIDGAYLSFLVRSFQTAYKLDFPHVPRYQLRIPHDRAYYYDSIPAKKKTQSDAEYEELRNEKLNHFEQISRLDGFFWRPGKSKYDPRQKKLTQKGVDVALATDLISHAFKGTAQKITVLAGDYDFLPALQAVSDLGVKINLLCSKNSVAEELFDVVDKVQFIDEQLLESWFTNHLTKPSWKPRAISVGNNAIPERTEKIGMFEEQPIFLKRENNLFSIYLNLSGKKVQLFQHEDLDVLKHYVKVKRPTLNFY